MRFWTKWNTAFLLSLAAVSVAPVGAAPVASGAQEMPVQKGGLPAATGRLKFKSAGPVCMCGDGMGEKDIEQALAKAKSGSGAGVDKGASHGQAGGQEKNLNLGAAK